MNSTRLVPRLAAISSTRFKSSTVNRTWMRWVFVSPVCHSHVRRSIHKSSFFISCTSANVSYSRISNNSTQLFRLSRAPIRPNRTRSTRGRCGTIRPRRSFHFTCHPRSKKRKNISRRILNCSANRPLKYTRQSISFSHRPISSSAISFASPNATMPSSVLNSAA